MSNNLTTFKLSKDFHLYIVKKARAEERSTASYIRQALKVYSGYSGNTLAKDESTKDLDDELTFDE